MPWVKRQDFDRFADEITAIREALASEAIEQPAQQQEPWPEEPAGHIAGGVQPSTQQDRWVERWYGSLAEKGWWICCGREHIAHLGIEVSSDEVRKIVDAHNRYKPAAQQQEPVAWLYQYKPAGTRFVTLEMASAINHQQVRETPLYTSPPAQRKPLTDEEIENIQFATTGDNHIDRARNFARAIEAAHGIKE